MLGITKISDDLIEEVMFLSESESDKKSESEQEKKIQAVIVKSRYITVM